MYVQYLFCLKHSIANEQIRPNIMSSVAHGNHMLISNCGIHLEYNDFVELLGFILLKAFILRSTLNVNVCH